MNSEITRLVDDGPISRKVTDKKMLQTLTSTVLGFWPNNKFDHFPAPLPVSLEEKNIYKLEQYPYLICIKSDGTRFLMMCFDGKTYMIDRTFNFFQINQNFDKVIYGSGVNDKCGVLFDGELVENKEGKWVYIVHDCICSFNKDVSQENFNNRYDAVKNILSDHWTAKDSDFDIDTKRFYSFSDNDIMELRNKLNNELFCHHIDGLIFTPVTLAVGTGTQFNLFKWKPRDLHTFDFKLNKLDDRFNAFYKKGKFEQLYVHVLKNTEDGRNFIKMLNDNCPDFVSGDIVEFKLNPETKYYDPFKTRTDKTHPNNELTVIKTLLNIYENITIEQLLSLKVKFEKSISKEDHKFIVNEVLNFINNNKVQNVVDKNGNKKPSVEHTKVTDYILTLFESNKCSNLNETLINTRQLINKIIKQLITDKVLKNISLNSGISKKLWDEDVVNNERNLFI